MKRTDPHPGLLMLLLHLRGSYCACRRIGEWIGKELADNLRDFRRAQEIVVTVARHDRQPRLRELRIQPSWFLHATAQQREEVGDVLLRDRIVVREYQKHRHRQLRGILRPVIVLTHHISNLSRNWGKRCGSGQCFENRPAGACIMFSAIAAFTWLIPRRLSGYQPDLTESDEITTSRRTLPRCWIAYRGSNTERAWMCAYCRFFIDLGHRRFPYKSKNIQMCSLRGIDDEWTFGRRTSQSIMREPSRLHTLRTHWSDRSFVPVVLLV